MRLKEYPNLKPPYGKLLELKRPKLRWIIYIDRYRSLAAKM